MERDFTKIIILLVVAAFLILLSMFFSAAESAFLSINKLRVRFLRNKKNKKAVRVWKLLQDKEKLINTLLVGNNIVNIALSSILTVVAIDLFGNAGVGIATFVATLLLLVFGEISPKTFATHNPEPIAFFASGFISFLEIVLTPLVWIFTKISRFILKTLKVDISNKKQTFTEEEIKTYIDFSREQGIIEKDEKAMMKRVFKFTDLEAKDIMIPRKNIKVISLDEKYNSIIEKSQRLRLSRFPVYRKDIDDIVGILYVKDLLFYKNRINEFSVEKVMRPPLFILQTKKMSSIQQMLHENHQSLAVVIDEYSGTYGVLTSEDIAREIFGPISDEYKSFAKSVELQIRNTSHAEVDGRTRLMDLNEQLGIELKSDRSETLNGYICEKTGAIPTVGSTIKACGYKFTVIKTDEHRASRVLIRQIEEVGGDK